MVELYVRVNGKERWADAKKVLEYLYPEQVKISGKMPLPYQNRVENFFKAIDKNIMDVWGEAYPNVNVKNELIQAKAWLISNPNKAKKDFKAFINRWLSKAMHNPNNKIIATAEKEISDKKRESRRYIREAEERARQDYASPQDIKSILSEYKR
tara:strand:+ start:703 stop:1164 length:462 start_codon:yes stop_codon:yes gene_type:complete